MRTTSFKPWRPHRGSCRGATAIEENNGSRREQWLTSLTVWTVHSICTYMIFIYIDISLLCEPNDAVRAVAVAKRREYAAISTLWRMDRFYKFVQISSSPTNSKPWPPTGNPPGVTGRLGTLAAPWTTRQYMYRIQTNGWHLDSTTNVGTFC